MRPALIPILFGTPGWVRALTPGATPQVAADFRNNRYWAAGVGNTNFSTFLALTRATPETVTWADGHLSYASSGQPAQGSIGLGVWNGRTNNQSSSGDLMNPIYWLPTGATLTQSGGAPDGSLLTLLTEDTSTGSHSIVPVNGAAAGAVSTNTYTHSFYWKSNGRQTFRYFCQIFNGLAEFITPSTNTVSSVTGGTSSVTTITNIGGGIYRITVTDVATVSGQFRPIINMVSTGTTISYTGDGISGAYLWGWDVELGSFASPYIPTMSAAASRNADVIQIIGALKTIFGSSAGWLYADLGGSPSTNTPTIWDKDNANNVPAYFDTTSTITSVMSGVSLQATLGSGSQASRVKSLVTWDASGRSLAANGGTVVSDANTLAGANTPYLGSGGGAGFFYSGNIGAIAAGNIRLPSTLAKSIVT